MVCYCLERGVLQPPGDAILHVAPSELSLIRRFQQSAKYHAVDLDPRLYRHTRTQRMDLMTLASTNEYDLAYLSHVMEHVPDDRRVLCNLYEALRPGGEAWFLVPLTGASTVDGSFDMSPKLREKLFGQWDHVRYYGNDFAERITHAGFNVEVIATSAFKASDCMLYGLNAEDKIFRGVKLSL